MLNSVEHEKSFITSGPDFLVAVVYSLVYGPILVQKSSAREINLKADCIVGYRVHFNGPHLIVISN